MDFTGKTALIAFITLTAASLLLISFTDHLILTPGFYKNNGDILGYDDNTLSAYLHMQQWIYFYEVIYLAVKLSVVALVLYTALYVSNRAISFATLFGITTLSEFIFVIAAFGKVIWFHYYYPDGTLEDWHKTYLLSALSLFPQVKAAWYYPLQTLNLFEIGYWFLLAFGLSRTSKLDFDNSLQMVLKSYLPALIVWVACVMFTTLLFFPNQA